MIFTVNFLRFLIPVNGCGTDGQLEDPTPTRDMYFENTIIIQVSMKFNTYCNRYSHLYIFFRIFE